MATIKATIRKRGIKGNEFPIIIRVIHNRAALELRVDNFRVTEAQWDEARQQVNPVKCRRAAVMNAAIRRTLRPLEDAHDTLALSGRSFTVRDIMDQVQRSNGNSPGSFLQYMEEYISVNPDELRYTTLINYQSTVARWKEYNAGVKTCDLAEKDIVGFRKFLIASGGKVNTVYCRLKIVRKMVRRAQKQRLLEGDPFAYVTLKQENGRRQHLTMEELAIVSEYSPVSITDELARDVFLFACHTGLRFSDICRLSKCNVERNGPSTRLSFRMHKTSDDVAFRISATAALIINKYEAEGTDLIFPMIRNAKSDITVERIISSQNAMLNKYLKEIIKSCEISKTISMHCGRHTFAVNSLAMGGDIYVLSKFLGHTSLSTTEIYAKAVDKMKDELTDLWNK